VTRAKHFMDHSQTAECLLAGLRAGAAEEKAARIHRLGAAEWKQVLAIAAQNHVSPLLYDRLKPLAASGRVPASVMQELRGLYLANAARNLKIYHELGEVLAGLRQAAIPVVVLKGAHLAALVYDNVALRPMGDVDLLVPAGEFVQARETLRGLGYDSGSSRDMAAVCRRDKSEDFSHAQDKIRIELHWTIEHPGGPATGLKVDMAGLWERAEPATLGGVDTLVFSPVDLLLHLCLEAVYHHGGEFGMGLRPFNDIAACVAHYQDRLDWNLLASRARAWGAAKFVGLGLQCAAELLGARVPAPVLEDLKPEGFDRRWEATIRQLIFFQHDATTKKQMRFWDLLVMFATQRLRVKARKLRQALLPSPVRMRILYDLPTGSKRVILWYPLRPWLLAGKYVLIAGRLARQPRSDPLKYGEKAAHRVKFHAWLHH